MQRLTCLRTAALLAALLSAATIACKQQPVAPGRDAPPYTPATPSGPLSGWIDSTYTYTTVTSDSNQDGVCYRFAWGDGDTSDWGAWCASGWPGEAAHAWHQPGTYQVTTQAKDASEQWSSWSNAFVVSISSSPPARPSSPIGPFEGTVDSLYEFAASAVDPAGDSVALRFDWGDGDTSDWSGFVGSGALARATHNWLASGLWVVRAQAKDREGGLSEWSDSSWVVINIPLKWSYLTGGSVNSSPAIGADGTIYFGSGDACLYAVNPDGTLKWSYEADYSIYRSPAIASVDGTIYIPADDTLLAVNPDGTLKWAYRAWGGSSFTSSPAVGPDGTVYVGCSDDSVHAINPNGTRKWRFLTGDYVYSSPAIASDGTIYVGSDDNYLYAIYPPDGTLRWRYRTGGDVGSSPAIGSDGAIYVGSEDGRLYAINPDGTLRWRYETSSSIYSSPTVAADGTIYFGSGNGYVHALNPDGTLRWRYEADGDVGSSPALASDGVIYFGSYYGYVYALNPDGTLKWQYQTGNSVSSSPAIAADGTVYIGSQDCCLYALPGSSPLASSPWPKFHHDNKNTGRVGGGLR